MAKKKFSGGLNSLLGEPQQAEEVDRQNQSTKKEITKTSQLAQRERNKILL
jgi:hypothetical protein